MNNKSLAVVLMMVPFWGWLALCAVGVWVLVFPGGKVDRWVAEFIAEVAARAIRAVGGTNR